MDRKKESAQMVYYKHLQIRLEGNLYEALRREAFENNTTMTGVIKTVLREHLNK